LQPDVHEINNILAQLLLRGARSLDDLDFTERYRHMLLMRAIVGICEDAFVQYSEGMCGAEPWESTKLVLRPIVTAPTFEAFWQQN